LADPVTILNKPVRTEGGFNLGKCQELMLDLKASMLHSIIIKKQIFPLFPKMTLLIQHKNIIEITKKNIIVKDSLIKLPIFAQAKKTKSPAPAMSTTSSTTSS